MPESSFQTAYYPKLCNFLHSESASFRAEETYLPIGLSLRWFEPKIHGLLSIYALATYFLSYYFS